MKRTIYDSQGGSGFLDHVGPLSTTITKVIYELEPSVVVDETERQLDRSRNAISHVGFSEEWARHNGILVYQDKS